MHGRRLFEGCKATTVPHTLQQPMTTKGKILDHRYIVAGIKSSLGTEKFSLVVLDSCRVGRVRPASLFFARSWLFSSLPAALFPPTGPLCARPVGGRPALSVLWPGGPAAWRFVWACLSVSLSLSLSRSLSLSLIVSLSLSHCLCLSP